MERIELAHIAGRFSMIRRDVKPFVQVGTSVLEAIREQSSVRTPSGSAWAFLLLSQRLDPTSAKSVRP